MAITRRPVDRDAAVHQPLACLVDILDLVGEMPEIATLAVALFIPVIGKLHLRCFIAGSCQKDEREAARLALKALEFIQPDQLEKRDSRIGIRHADHCVEIFHVGLIAQVRVDGKAANLGVGVGVTV